MDTINIIADVLVDLIDGLGDVVESIFGIFGDGSSALSSDADATNAVGQ